MKKVLALLMAAAMILSLAACGSSASTGTASTSASADGVYRTLDEIKGGRHDQHRRFSLTRTRSATSMKTASIRL